MSGSFWQKATAFVVVFMIVSTMSALVLLNRGTSSDPVPTPPPPPTTETTSATKPAETEKPKPPPVKPPPLKPKEEATDGTLFGIPLERAQNGVTKVKVPLQGGGEITMMRGRNDAPGTAAERLRKIGREAMIKSNSHMMANYKNAVTAMVDRAKAAGKRSVKVLETGTIRTYEEGHYSTLYASEVLYGVPEGVVVSVDINSESIRISRDVCNDASNVVWALASSLDFIKWLPETTLFDVVLLDSANDPKHIFREFKLVVPHLAENSLLLVDDSGILANGERGGNGQKGLDVYDFLKKANVPVKVMDAGEHGTQLYVECTKEHIDAIKAALATF